MATVISNNHFMHKLGDRIKRPAGPVVIKMLRTFWYEYRRSQYLLTSSYHRHPMARGMPRRVWGRHSALFILMDNADKD